MTNKHSSIQIVMEAILLFFYAWNSAPILGTDLSRSFVALGCKFRFPINFSADKHWNTLQLDLAAHHQASREIAKILVKEQCVWHREFINVRQPDPKVTLSMISCLLVELHNLMLPGGMSTSLLIHSPGLGASSPISMVPCTKLNTVLQRNGRSSMRQIFHIPCWTPPPTPTWQCWQSIWPNTWEEIGWSVYSRGYQRLWTTNTI